MRSLLFGRPEASPLGVGGALSTSSCVVVCECDLGDLSVGI